jgi:N-acetylneuraminic acid mutarotase
MEPCLNRSIAFVFILVFTTAPCVIIIQPVKALEDSWTTKEPMPTPRTSLGVAVVNDKIYAIGGYPDLNVTEQYDPKTDTWTTKTAMPTPRFNFAVAVCQNKIYCIGGLIRGNNSVGASLTGAIEVYDPETDTWETKKPMNTPRAQLEANVVDDKIFLMGGRTGGQGSTVTLNEAYYPISESWSEKAPMPFPVILYASVVVGSKIYVMGGQDEFNYPLTMDKNQIYDAVTDSWSFGAALPNGVSDSSACSIVTDNPRIYLIGGHPITGNASTDIVQIFNPNSNSWGTGTSMPSTRFGLCTATIEGTIFAIGGTKDYSLPNEMGSAKNEMYTPASQTASNPDPSPSVPELPLSFMLIVLVTTSFLLVFITARRRILRRSSFTTYSWNN